MGNTIYDTASRSVRSSKIGYATKSVGEIFTQQRERKAHAEMDPKNIKIRECRDSEAHPAVIPVILGLDVTGSMGHIPHQLIKDGLPTLMGGMIQKGVDASLLFVACGDHECDKYPLQAGQFESGDAELDLWLTRTYLEGGGGGNAGESYLLAWHFAVNKVVTDSWDKRKQKGFLFTVGDEPNLPILPGSAIEQIYGEPAQTVTAAELLAAAQEKFQVYHLHIARGYRSGTLDGWKKTLGQACIEVADYHDIPEIITKIVSGSGGGSPIPETQEVSKKEEQEIL